jgi:Flp pilus assembly protein TadD
MKTKNLSPIILFAIFMVLILSCGKEDQESKVKKPSDEPMFRTEGTNVKEGEKSIASLAVLAQGGALMAEESSAGAKENREGIGHYKEGHWAESEKYFRKALEVNASLAEAHYNLALALDKLGNHGDATEHFKKALELAPDNPKIRDSKILKDHVGA